MINSSLEVNKNDDYLDMLERANEKIHLGQDLIAMLQTYTEIQGVQKIQRKIQQEIKFLQKVIGNGTLKANHIQCTNLTHYEFLVNILQQQCDVVHVDCGFAMGERENPLRVDIVCEQGLKWIKAIARNSKSLTAAANGATSYGGARSILETAQDFMEASAENRCMFQQPKVIFYFAQAIASDLLDALRSIGVETATLDDVSCVALTDDAATKSASNISTLNLDITTMLAYVSNVCNGNCNWLYQEAILNEQAERERATPLRPLLDKMFMGKRLICCETAHKAFEEIVGLLAGPQERQRASELLQRVAVLPDVAEVPHELTDIRLSGKINQRSLRIFAFGVEQKAITVTSNKAFIRSAKMQGINVPVFTHQARALTEMKEISTLPSQLTNTTATLLPQN